MGEELQVLTKSGRLVDGEGLKHWSGSPCKRQTDLVELANSMVSSLSNDRCSSLL